MYEDGIYHIMLMSSPGHIYTEVLNEDSSTKFGSFYVTNTLEVSVQLKLSNEVVIYLKTIGFPFGRH